MNWWESILLGLLQGLTEFLPVSSSGHLVLGQHLLGLEAGSDGVLFEVLLHFGTVMSIAWVYRARLGRLAADLVHAARRPASIAAAYREQPNVRLGAHVLLTMVPTGLVYVLFGDAIEEAFGSPRLAAGMLLVTGTLLLLTMWSNKGTRSVGPWNALLIGLAQAAAMIPGISRSGATICTALYQKIQPEEAADFSFLMLLPVVLGATALKLGEAASVVGAAAWDVMLPGVLAAFLSGIVAIRLVIAFVRQGRFHLFAAYCFAVGVAGLLFL
ncbi:MAG: undecaprenyl-diphosphate phosphatase [Bacteroidetes bacterium]|nr:undecaprenyl-diphosphate phosphatase [Bacteroidota bacterium]MDA0874575.1 undecaprenyl-diphosphate phosphatase [Bacteroidota bacterium]